MVSYNKYKKGSEWRKWDLHVHTPSSIYQKYGPNDETTWQSFITDIEGLPSEFAVLGINDYFFIDGYERLSKEKNENGKLTNVECLLPVVEFRIEKFAGIDFGSLKRINLHVIFSDEIPVETIKSQFLNTLEQSYFLESGEPWTRAITRESVEELGKQIKSGVPASELAKYGSDLTEGFNNLNVKEDRIFEALNKDCFKGKYLIAIGKTEWGDLKWTDASIATKKSIINRADIVFTASKSIEDFDKAKSQLKAQAVNHLLLDCSDAHYFSNSTDKDRIGNCFTWIKADPTFEGLKQITYEPDLRVSIHANLPEDKSGYQVIDKIEIFDTHIFNANLELNPNLNSIIGGRSTGKSVLLAAIAKKLKTDKPVVFEYNDEYDKFVSEISKNLKIYWKDGLEEDTREIEYFRQGYMYELAREDTKLSQLIQDILKQKGKETILNSYQKSVSENKKKISGLINDFFQIIKDINEKEQKASEKGDKTGIEGEILKLTEELHRLNITTVSVAEKESYDQLKETVEKNKEKLVTLRTDILTIESLKELSLVKENISYELTSISDESKISIDKIFDELKSNFSDRWKASLDEVISKTNNLELGIAKIIQSVNENSIFIRVSKAYGDSSQLSDYQEKIKTQKNKLFELNILHEEIDKLKKQKEELKSNIKSAHQLYFANINAVVPSLSNAKDQLEIKAKVKFNLSLYKDILFSSLNQQGAANQGISNYIYINNDQYEQHLFDLLESLIDDKITLKSGYNNQTLTNRLLSECFYYLNYDIEYEGDDFKKMSDGKKAFVVLKLLLDFSNKDCPILIDQPEDDLDNRAIYSELVQYLKKKKVVRQIIIATHNPNIVVGADSELVIIANQNGHKNSNRDGKKFQYIGGSLEHTCKKNELVSEVLECQGIREHVCEVLEGGNIAFKLREKKYALENF